MKDLIAELEAAPKGSRELEYKIAIALDWHENGVSIQAFIEKFPDSKPLHRKFPKWTRSLDAARLLVQGCRWEVQQDRTAAFASVDGETTGRIATPELALCIAALLAHQVMEAA
jgi:hypothetical protein